MQCKIKTHREGHHRAGVLQGLPGQAIRLVQMPLQFLNAKMKILNALAAQYRFDGCPR